MMTIRESERKPQMEYFCLVYNILCHFLYQVGPSRYVARNLKKCSNTCWILQEQTTFGGSNTHLSIFFKSMSNIAF